MIAEKYTVAKARELGWSSLGSLAPYRLEHLDQYTVGRSVLDAGCGGGGYVDYLCRRGFEATGIDSHESILDVHREQRFAGNFVLADLSERLPFDDDSFDTSIVFDVLEHVDDRAALRELARVTRRRIILTVPQADKSLHRYGLTVCTHLDCTHLRYYTRDLLAALIQDIEPRQYVIEDELELDIIELARNRLYATSRYSWLTPLYQEVLKFLLTRSYARPQYMNFLAVIDLD